MKAATAYQVIILLLMTASLAQVAFSQNITVDISIANEFKTNESVTFDYILASNEDADISYIPTVSCLSAPIPQPQVMSSRIIKNQLLKGTYSGFGVTEDILSQTCTAEVFVISPVKQEVKKEFSINANPRLKLDIMLCRNEKCTEESKVFLSTDNIYVKYESDTGIVLDASLTHPNGSVQKISLPMAIKPDAGIYELNVNVQKIGYVPIEKVVRFAVVEKEAEIPLAGVCNADGICDSNEKLQNCPQDCSSGRLEELLKLSNLTTIILISGIVTIGIAILIFNRLKKRSNYKILKEKWKITTSK